LSPNPATKKPRNGQLRGWWVTVSEKNSAHNT
jgi:hypothetical protein